MASPKGGLVRSARGWAVAPTALIAAFLGGGAVHGLPPTDTLPDALGELERVAKDEFARLGIPGAAVALVKDDRVVFLKGFGVPSVETGLEATPDTLFQIGSVTKTFTAALLALLAEEGRVDLDLPVGRYVKGLSPGLSRLTTAQLLSHTGGLKDEPAEFGLHDEGSLAEYARSWTDEYGLFPPGQVFSYSNSGFALAGLVAQEAAGQPFADLMGERVFQPLGMVRATFRPTVAMTYPLAVGHRLVDAKPVVVRPLPDDARLWPAGTAYSSARELAQFAIAFLNDGKLDGRQALPPSIVGAMSRPRVEVPTLVSPPASYGLGLFINATYRGVRQLWHDGSMTGYRASLRMVPDHRVAVVTLTNGEGGPLVRTTERALELLVPLGPKVEPKALPAFSLSDAERQAYVGTYTQPSRWTAEVALKDGGLVLKQFGLELPLRCFGGGRFQVQPPDAPGPQDIVIRPPADGRPGSLHQFVWAFRRIDPAR